MNAKVTLSVVGFRNLMSPAEIGYVDAVTSLAPHPSVTLLDRSGRPTLRCKGPVDLEIRAAPANASTSYRVLGVYFKQHTDGGGVKPDVGGRLNFEQYRLADETLVIRNKAVQTGRDGRYEFFVLIEDLATGAIGLIDPDIEAELPD